MSVPEAECIGPDGSGGCRFPAVLIVAGDGTCQYHVLSVIRRRMEESGKAVAVWSPQDPGSGYSAESLAPEDG